MSTRVTEPGRRPLPGTPARWRVHAGIAAALAVTLTCLARVDAAPPGRPALPALKVGVSLALTGPDARWGIPMLRGVELAVADVNGRRGAGGRVLETIPLDSAATGQDTLSRQGAVAAAYERFVADPTVIAAIGPQTSLEGRVAAPLLSRANLATITPSSTTFYIGDPALRATFRPGGQAVYFRTVGTDLAQGDAMARFAHARLGVRRVVLLHDGSQLGERTLGIFVQRATTLGITVLAKRLIGWLNQDYRKGLRELALLKPDAVFAAVRYGVGVKLARQVPEILPSVHLLGTESLYNSAFPIQARATRAEGWYVPNVAPDPGAGAGVLAWAERYRGRFGSEPSGYSLTAYTAVIVIADAVSRVVERGRPVTRANVREAIGATRLPDAVGGAISFDSDGELERPAVSIYQVRSGGFQHVETVYTTGVKPGAEALR